MKPLLKYFLHKITPAIFLFANVFLCLNYVSAQCTVTITSFPYNEDFETSQGNWFSGGTNDDWAWGTPTKPVISNAASGLKCWITGGLNVSFYNLGERSWVQSPCFDFTTLTNPMIEFSVFWETEKTYDGGSLQYSLNNGSIWNNVGSAGQQPDCLNDNWFTAGGIINLATLASPTEGWCGNVQPTLGGCLGGGGSNGWVIAKQVMPYLAGQSQVIFRFSFGSGTTCNNYDGFAFDNVIIKDAPLPLTLSTSSTEQGCNQLNGSVASVAAGGILPYAYLWSNGATTDSVFNLAAATYTITITDGNGCTKTATCVVNTSPAVTINATALDDTCSSGRGLAFATAGNGTQPFSYLWSNGVTGDTAGFLLTGFYDVTVTDSQNCTASVQVLVNDFTDFSFSFGNDTGVCLLQPFFLSAGNQSAYLWQNGSTQSSVLVQDAGIYWVEVINTAGCVAADTIMIYDNCLDDVIAPNALTPNSDLLNEVFLVYTPYAENFKMIIYNRWGQKIFETINQSEGWNGLQNNAPAPEGVYMWQVSYANGNTTIISKGLVRLLR